MLIPNGDWIEMLEADVRYLESHSVRNNNTVGDCRSPTTRSTVNCNWVNLINIHKDLSRTVDQGHQGH